MPGDDGVWEFPDDPLGAFCRDNHVALAPTGSGPLDGLTFAAKDVFHVDGHRSGFGHPDWLKTHPPARETAVAIDRLLRAGARMVGKTLTDEITYSLTGENMHYGTPVNPRCPDRVPGGSSSGSVAAVAGGLVDFAIGTDCGGSVRLPASYCGVLGMRPSHGRVPLAGTLPFAPSFDTVGWFARDAAVFEMVGRVLLDDDGASGKVRRLILAPDAFALVDPAVRAALADAVDAVKGAVRISAQAIVGADGLTSWMECFRLIQGAEIWSSLRQWVREVEPTFGPGIRERIEWASQLDSHAVTMARRLRARIVERLEELLRPCDILCLPTSPRVAPMKNTPTSQLEVTYRYQAMCLLCIAGLGQLPQISMPLATVDGCPLGLSIVGRYGADVQLLGLAKVVMEQAEGGTSSRRVT